MIIIELTYKDNINDVDKHVEAHRQFLQKNYDEGIFIASGAKVPRTGGVIIANTDLDSAKKLVKDDPFFQYNIADYRFVEFEASRCTSELTEKLNIPV